MNLDRKMILCAVAAILVIGVLFTVGKVSHRSRREPVNQGKTLTEWLKQLDDGQGPEGISSSQINSPTPRQLDAARAIQAMGTNAIPWLMLDIRVRSDPNSAHIRFHRWLERHLPARVSRMIDYNDVTKEDATRWGGRGGVVRAGPVGNTCIARAPTASLHQLLAFRDQIGRVRPGRDGSGGR